MDRLMPLQNETRQRIYPYHPEYFFVDSERYFFQLFSFHGIFVVAFSTLAVAAIDSMMVANIVHACGLFAIVCHRLENIGRRPRSREDATGLRLVDDRDVYRRCLEACQLHLSSLNSVRGIQESFSTSFLVVMGAGVVAIGMLMFDFLSSLDEPLRLVIIAVLLFGINVCLFYLNWVVQQVIDSSEEVFQYAYYSQWYNLSINSRKMIMIILQNSMKPVALSAASICDLNLEMFASVVKTSMSYATVMLSMQQQ
uniref:Odorant receptor 49 n=1 Tax=Chouioia cunea TaxID=1570515 RepID=A0A6B9CK13_9HYME|nr:odorant receptor 49 [Chouioia cunea]